MFQMQMDCTRADAAVFDKIFWRFVRDELAHRHGADVSVVSTTLGAWERRIVTFGEDQLARSFASKIGRFQAGPAPAPIINPILA